MIKRLKTLLIILCLCVFTCGCDERENAGILFNAVPIDKETISNSSRTFEAGKKIYYLFYTPKKIDTEFIRVQVFKAGDKIPRGGYLIVWTCDYRIMKQNMYYYYNNFVLYEAGRYVMQVFSTDNLSEPLAWNYFYIVPAR